MRLHRLFVVFAAFFLLAIVSVAQTSDLSSIPRFVKYTGTAPSGSSVTFAIYDRQDAFAPLWLETQSVTADEAGHYTVLLGSTKADGLPASIFASNEARWIGVKVGDAPESPRTLLVSVPYALKAGDAETLGGKPLSAFVMADSSSNATAAGKASRLGGTPEVGRANPEPAAPGDSGTQSHLAKFAADGVTLGDSALVEIGGRLGIGTTSPSFPLELVGSNVELLQRNPSSTSYAGMRFYNDQNSALHALEIDYSGSAYPGALTGAGPSGEQSSITNNGPFPMTFGTNNVARVTISGSGNVGIGTNNPNFPLELVGSNVAFLQRNPSASSYTGMRFYNDQNNALRALEIDYSGSAYPGALIAAGPTGEQTSITNNGPYPMSFGTNNTARITIAGAGNVGIGNSNPQANLDVTGNIHTTGTIFFNDGSQQSAAGVSQVVPSEGLTTSVIANHLSVGLQACPTGQVLQSAGSTWACAAAGGVASVAATSGGGVAVGGTATNPTVGLLTGCTANQVLAWSGTAWQCTTPAGNGGVTLPFSGTAGNGTAAFAVTQTQDTLLQQDPTFQSALNSIPAGVAGISSTTSTTNTAVGVFGGANSPGSIGVVGWNGATDATGSNDSHSTGVLGRSDDPNGTAIQAEESATSGNSIGIQVNVKSPTGTGISVQGAGGTAAVFNGKVQVANGVLEVDNGIDAGGGSPVQVSGGMSISGNVTVNGSVNAQNVTAPTMNKGSGTFKIDHPLDPLNKYLYHSFVESPDMMNIYNGITTLDSRGRAVITMPDWFEALNMDFRYQLTAMGASMPGLYISKEVENNRFEISGGKPHAKVSWQVTGIRHDAFANTHRVVVEEKKPLAEQGKHLWPDAYPEDNANAAANGGGHR